MRGMVLDPGGSALAWAELDRRDTNTNLRTVCKGFPTYPSLSKPCPTSAHHIPPLCPTPPRPSPLPRPLPSSLLLQLL